MNKCIFLGYLTKDFEMHVTDSVTVAKGSMALDRGKDKNGDDLGADFPTLTAFGKRAEFCEKFGKKGRRFLVECHVKTGSFEKDGKKTYTTDFVIDRIEFADSKQTNNEPAPAPDGWMNVVDVEAVELPFN